MTAWQTQYHSGYMQSDIEASWEKLAEAVTNVGGYGEATAKAVLQKARIGKANI